MDTPSKPVGGVLICAIIAASSYYLASELVIFSKAKNFVSALVVLGLVHVLVSIAVFIANPARKVRFCVIALLILGQLQLTEFLWMVAMWSRGGFAP